MKGTQFCWQYDADKQTLRGGISACRALCGCDATVAQHSQGASNFQLNVKDVFSPFLPHTKGNTYNDGLMMLLKDKGLCKPNFALRRYQFNAA